MDGVVGRLRGRGRRDDVRLTERCEGKREIGLEIRVREREIKR